MAASSGKARCGYEGAGAKCASRDSTILDLLRQEKTGASRRLGFLVKRQWDIPGKKLELFNLLVPHLWCVLILQDLTDPLTPRLLAEVRKEVVFGPQYTPCGSTRGTRAGQRGDHCPHGLPGCR